MAFYLFRGRSLNNLTISFTKRHFVVCVMNCMCFMFKFLFYWHTHLFSCFLIFTVPVYFGVRKSFFFRTTEYPNMSPNQFYILHSRLQVSVGTVWQDKDSWQSSTHWYSVSALHKACFSVISHPLLKALLSSFCLFLFCISSGYLYTL